MAIRLLLVMTFLTSISHAAIYGVDSRRDISKLPKMWQQAASAVAVSLPTFYLLELDKDHFYHEEFDQRPYAESVGLCEDEKFANQKTFGHCSAFLVSPKHLITAAHCIIPTGEVVNEKHDYCNNFSYWLGYNDSTLPFHALGAIIRKKDVVHCKKVIYAINNNKMEPEDNPMDFAVIELEEEVTHIKPLKVSLKELLKGQRVATIGHPHGLPAKFSGFSPLRGNYDTTLSSFMDTLSGNSGGPAFNANAEVIGILVSGHQYDTYEDKKNKCDRLNTCSVNGLSCDVPTELENSNLLMKSQVWYPYVTQ